MRERIQLVRDLSNALAAYLHSLPEDVWRNAEDYASACDGWKAADVVAHLIHAALSNALIVERALKGDPSPPMVHRIPEAEEVERTIELRVAYGEDLFPEFNATCRRLNSLLVSLGPADYGLPPWRPNRGVPISSLIETRAEELALHDWDIRYGLDRDAKLSPKALPFLTAWTSRRFQTAFKGEQDLDSPITYRFILDEPVAEVHDVVIGRDGACTRSTSVGNGDADVTFRCSTDTYILLGAGRLPFARTVRRGRLRFEGDEELASRFADWFRPP